MLICFKCSDETKRTLDNLGKSQGYGGYSEAISVALANLAALHEELGDRDSMVISAALTRSEASSGSGRTAAPIPEIFCSDGLEEPSALAPMPQDPRDQLEVVWVNEWIFGQYNRLLPAKANCRALAHLLKGQPEGVPLEEAAEEIAENAAVLGELLAWHDEENSLRRDDKLATAFPHAGPRGEKGRARYANQFVGHVDRKGGMHGLLYDYKLVNAAPGDGHLLQLTEPGWNFASLPNPILDGLQEELTQRFTADERKFLLEHIRSSVPAERFAFGAVLRAIDEGKNTPGELDYVLERHIPLEKKSSFSDSFFALQRSGAVCRMLDVGLIKRVRLGVRVSYAIAGDESAFDL